MDRRAVTAWLRTTDDHRLEELWARADRVRRATVGDAVHLRGLLEISNCCERACTYCGLRKANRAIERYRLDATQILRAASLAADLGYGTVVLQAGEDDGIRGPWLADVIRRIKGETARAVTLSLGERTPAELELWRAAGADRYLLRFETSAPDLFRRIHPPRRGHAMDRLDILRLLRDLGYEVGSGVMVGLPGQTCASLADDLALFRELDLDMIGLGPFIPHPGTPLGAEAGHPSPPGPDRAPATERMASKMLALARLTCPTANIPSTTALATLDRSNGLETGLKRGANVVMPDLTPQPLRALYEIYPGKGTDATAPRGYHTELMHRLAAVGRHPGTGPGASPNFMARHAATRNSSLQQGTQHACVA